MNQLGIFINEQLALAYDRSTPLDDQRQKFLEKMDTDMDRGIKIHGELIAEPDRKDKATFVAMNLIKSLQQEDHARVGVCCAWLSSRLPHVLEVHARDHDSRVEIELIESY